jgi:hypothetical protein
MAKSWQGCVVLGDGNEVGMPSLPIKSRVMLLLRMGNEVLHNACFFSYFCSKFSDIL